MGLREYRFETDRLQPVTWVTPMLAERPGEYPAIKIGTPLGEFALVATISQHDSFGTQHRRRSVQVHHDAAQALRTGEATRRTIDQRHMGWSGGAIIPLGQTLQRKLSAFPHDTPPNTAHELDYSAYDKVYGSVVQRGHLYGLTEPAYELDDIYDRCEDAYEPIMAIYPVPPTRYSYAAGETPIALQPLGEWDDLIDRVAGTIVVPSLLKTTYLTEE